MRSMVEGALSGSKNPSTSLRLVPLPRKSGGEESKPQSLSNSDASCSTIVPPNCSASMIVTARS